MSARKVGFAWRESALAVLLFLFFIFLTINESWSFWVALVFWLVALSMIVFQLKFTERVVLAVLSVMLAFFLLGFIAYPGIVLILGIVPIVFLAIAVIQNNSKLFNVALVWYLYLFYEIYMTYTVLPSVTAPIRIDILLIAFLLVGVTYPSFKSDKKESTGKD